jgi:hypothetical protein
VGTRRGARPNNKPLTPAQTPEPKPTVRLPGPTWSLDALRYWELRRLLYNAVLAVITIWQLVVHHAFPPQASAAVAMLFVLAVVANILYSAAYLVDVFVQTSVYRNG